MNKWQDISKAPKDGTLILIKERDGRVQVARWKRGNGGYGHDWYVQLSNNGYEGHGTFPTIDVVKWMHIPNDN